MTSKRAGDAQEPAFEDADSAWEAEVEAARLLLRGRTPLLYKRPTDGSANDNDRLADIVRGSVWRSAAAREEEGEAMPDRRSRDLAGELDFSDTPVRRRGFLDEDGF